jgi:RNA polymerase sigma factor (sigma-70 family)
MSEQNFAQRLWLSREDDVDPPRSLTALKRALDECLTARQREAVELYFFEGLSQSEIARRLGVSQQVIHKRIYGVDRRGKRIGGALTKLRRALSAPTV